MTTERLFPGVGYELVPGQAAAGGMNKREFDGMIDGFGERMSWERYSMCPCAANADTDQPDPLCAHCFGGGALYFEEAELIRGVVAQPTYRHTDKGMEGQRYTGSIQITFRAETPVGYRHRLTMLDQVMEYAELIDRAASPQRVRFPVATRTMTYRRIADPTVTETFATSVLRATYRNVAKEIVDLVPGVDFGIDEDGLIDWTAGIATGRVPAVDTTIALVYWTHPRYVITSLAPFPMQNVYTNENVPTPLRQNLPITLEATIDFLRVDR